MRPAYRHALGVALAEKRARGYLDLLWIIRAAIAKRSEVKHFEKGLIEQAYASDPATELAALSELSVNCGSG